LEQKPLSSSIPPKETLGNNMPLMHGLWALQSNTSGVTDFTSPTQKLTVSPTQQNSSQLIANYQRLSPVTPSDSLHKI
jgi:hypothetical protein